MIVELGDYTLCAAMLVAIAALFAAITSVRSGSEPWLRAARWLTIGITGLLAFASALLLRAMVTSDFSLQYVAEYTERTLPIGYKLAAFWAGQEGSLLLWALILGGLNTLVIFRQRRLHGIETAATIATLACVAGFFTALLLFAANPFKATTPIPDDGMGLNPMLQNPGMIIHPPLLFIGYAGYTIPFAMLIGALVAGRRDNQWLANIRSWNLFSWLFLSAGILWGAEWSYSVLGWGGYWAWDPVENASLLPWLTGTALLHSANIQQQRGIFKRWNASLIAGTFILCIFGTYLTRSGVVSSVHSFGANSIGNFFVAFMVVAGLVSLALMMVRRSELQPENRMEHLIGREGAFLGANVLLTLIMFATLIGTIFPLLSSWTVGHEISLNASFYNRIVVPMALALVALMSMGPMLRYGANAGAQLGRWLTIPLVLSSVAAIAMWAVGIHSAWAIACTFLVSLTLFGIAIELGKAVYARSRNHGETYITALVGLLDANHRRYGGQLAHLGVALIVVGVAGSSLFSVKQTHELTPGQTLNVAGYSIKFNGLLQERRANYTAVVAELTLSEPSGAVRLLRPERRFYDKAENAYSEVAIQSSLREDLYVVLAGWEQDGKITAVQSIINPLVNWIWIGGFVMAGGAVLCLLPQLLPTARPVLQQADESASQPVKEAAAVALSRSVS